MRLRRATAAAAAAVLLVACGTEDPDPGAAPGTDQPTADDADPDGEGGDGGEQPELVDPAEFVTDGVFRGRGLVLPLPDGWRIDEMLFAQGLIAAVPEGDSSQQLVAQAVNVADLPEEEQFDFDELVESQRAQFASGDEIVPAIDEALDLAGAERAHRLRFEDVQLGERGDVWLDLLVAEDGEGRVALFNYLAPADAYDGSVADLLVEGAGIDPNSQPPPPPSGAPEGDAGQDGPQPVEPGEGIGDGAGPPGDG